nr:MAG TPA: hypothetical protein [Caudoviricetes sp.]
MAKFWHSGMIDKKIVKEREEAEYINKLHKTILELRCDNVGDLINDTTDYDEIRQGDNITLEFHNWLIKNADKRCKADIEFGRKIEALKNENNTRALRQEE